MKKKFILVPIVLLLMVLLLSTPCDQYLSCRGKMSDILGYPGQWFLVLIPLSFFALTLTDKKHKFWLKFTGIFFAVSMILVFAMPETARGLMLNPDRESTNWFLGGLYSFISVVYFIVQFFKKRKLGKS